MSWYTGRQTPVRLSLPFGTSPAELLQQIKYQVFWTEERRAKARENRIIADRSVKPCFHSTRGSAKPDEYPHVLGLYLNRLRDGMLLRADPTVKYAWKSFGLRRILHKHLRDSHTIHTSTQGYLYAIPNPFYNSHEWNFSM